MSQQNHSIIILRGPSCSGKSTIAKLIMQKIKDAVLIDQDYFAEEVFRHEPGFKEATRETIIAITEIAESQKRNVLIEGILNLDYYRSFFDQLINSSRQVLFVYINVPFEVTILRHRERSKAQLFGEKEMSEWFNKSAPLNSDNELIISDLSAEEAAIKIIHMASW